MNCLLAHHFACHTLSCSDVTRSSSQRLERVKGICLMHLSILLRLSPLSFIIPFHVCEVKEGASRHLTFRGSLAPTPHKHTWLATSRAHPSLRRKAPWLVSSQPPELFEPAWDPNWKWEGGRGEGRRGGWWCEVVRGMARAKTTHKYPSYTLFNSNECVVQAKQTHYSPVNDHVNSCF